MDERIICIIGTGGFARETLSCLIDGIASTGLKIEKIAVFMERDDVYNETEIMGVPVIKESEFIVDDYSVVVAIGDPIKRKKVVESLPPKTNFITIIHPTAIISDWVKIGKGSIITAGTILTCNINIGKHAQINLQTTIGHDCSIGNYFTTAPNVNISGDCEFGECVYFGTNSAIRQGIKICNNVTIGMGGIVVKDINDEGVYIGNPVKKMTKN